MTYELLNTLPNMILMCASRYFGTSFDKLARQQQQMVVDAIMLYGDMTEAQIERAFNIKVTSQTDKVLDSSSIDEQTQELNIVISTILDQELSQPA